LAAKKGIATLWMKTDENYLRAEIASSRASHEH